LKQSLYLDLSEKIILKSAVSFSNSARLNLAYPRPTIDPSRMPTTATTAIIPAVARITSGEKDANVSSDTEELALMDGAGAEVASAFAITRVAALAYLMFNLFTPPCFAAIGAMNSEMKSAKWLWGAIGFQMGTGFTIGFLVYQIGTLITTGSLGAGFIGGLIAVLAYAAVITFLCIKGNKKIQNENAAKRQKSPAANH
jgi:hypothetical protein